MENGEGFFSNTKMSLKNKYLTYILLDFFEKLHKKRHQIRRE